MRARLTATCTFIALLLAASCTAHAEAPQRYSRAQAQKALEKSESGELVIGEFSLDTRGVIDGDTIRVQGLKAPLRLVGLDAEETFKSKRDRSDAEQDFDAYLRDRRGHSRHPVKAATPMGEEAKRWAKDFFAGVERVRLERDHPKEVNDRYGRYLAYVLVQKNGTWLNYNVECVRAGMSPYFTKYAYSRRYHDEFVAAEREAHEARRGIWNPSSQGYRDYDERKVWWNARAEFVRAFEQKAERRGDHIDLTHEDAFERLEQRVGKEATVLGTVGRIKLGERGPTRVLLGRRLFDDFPVIFFDKEVFESSGIAGSTGEFVVVSGTVQVYENKYTGERELQLVVRRSSQVRSSRGEP